MKANPNAKVHCKIGNNKAYLTPSSLLILAIIAKQGVYIKTNNIQASIDIRFELYAISSIFENNDGNATLTASFEKNPAKTIDEIREFSTPKL